MVNMRTLFIGLLCIACLPAWAQKRIGFRHDDYVATTWKGIDSLNYDYDAQGNLTWLYAVKGNATNGWDWNYKTTILYNANNQRETQTREKGGNGFWENEHQYHYSYNVNNHLTSIEYWKWINNAWTNVGKIEYNGLNSFGKPQEEINYVWNNGAWKFQSKKYYEYVNGQDLVQSEDLLYWDITTLTWKKFERRYYTYVQTQIGTYTYMVPDTNNAWRNVSKTLNLYNANLQITQKLEQQYDTLLYSFQDVYRHQYTYGANGKLAENRREEKNGSTWTPTHRTTYLYAANDSLAEWFYEQNNGSWEFLNRTTYGYTGPVITEEKHYTGVGNTWSEINRLQTTYNSNNDSVYVQKDNTVGSNYEPVYREFFYYNVHPLTVADPLTSTIRCYPNPCRNQFQVNFSASAATHWVLLDVLGRKRMEVFQPAAQTSLQFNVEHIPAGTYLLFQNGHYVQALVKE
jgi:hypothetical protein